MRCGKYVSPGCTLDLAPVQFRGSCPRRLVFGRFDYRWTFREAALNFVPADRLGFSTLEFIESLDGETKPSLSHRALSADRYRHDTDGSRVTSGRSLFVRPPMTPRVQGESMELRSREQKAERGTLQE